MTFKEFLSSKGISDEDFAAKSAEEVAGLFNEHNDNVRSSIEKAVEEKASKEDIIELKSELNNAIKDQMNHLNEVISESKKALKEQGLAIEKIVMNNSPAGETKSIKENLRDNLEGLKALKEGAADKIVFKAVGTMLLSTNISGGNVPVEQRIPGLNDIASRQPRFLDFMARATASSNIISWVYKANREGATDVTGEGSAKNQIDFDLVVNSENIKKVTNFIKVSDEMIDDIDFIESEIRRELLNELLRDVESQAYEGAGTGNNLNGVLTVATAFAAGASAGQIDNANWIDVLGAAKTQIMEAQQPMPTHIFMHPRDVYEARSTKVSTSDRRYVERLLEVSGTLTMDGIPIIETTLVTQGTYLIGHMPFAILYEKQGVQIEVGYDADDFTKNLRTIRCEWRGAAVVKNNDRTAFVTGTFATDESALETT